MQWVGDLAHRVLCGGGSGLVGWFWGTEHMLVHCRCNVHKWLGMWWMSNVRDDVRVFRQLSKGRDGGVCESKFFSLQEFPVETEAYISTKQTVYS